MVVRSAPQRRERRSFGAEREAGILAPSLSPSLSLSHTHLIFSCTWTDACTCLKFTFQKSVIPPCSVRAFALRCQCHRGKHGDICILFPSASSLRDGTMGGKQQFINERTLMGSFKEEFTDCRRKSSLFAPVPGSRRIFCRVRHETGLISLQWRHYPKLSGKR